MRISLLALGVFFSIGCTANDSAINPPTAIVFEERTAVGQPLAGIDGVVLNVTARVKEVDLVTRRVTLLDSNGQTVTIKAGHNIKRLDQVKPGDSVVVEYIQATAFEVRPPTEGEIANPVVGAIIAARSAEGEAPAGGVAEVIRSVVKVAAIDKQSETVTIALPDGQLQTIKARHPENLDRARVGDTIVVEYAEAVGLNLVKR